MASALAPPAGADSGPARRLPPFLWSLTIMILSAWQEGAGIPESPSVSRTVALSPAAGLCQPRDVPSTTAPTAMNRVNDAGDRCGRPVTCVALAAGSHAHELSPRVLEAVYGGKRPACGDEVQS
jgi:hypothetical protein